MAPRCRIGRDLGMFLMVPYVPGTLGPQQPHFSRSPFHPSTLPPVERPRWPPLLHLQRAPEIWPRPQLKLISESKRKTGRLLSQVFEFLIWNKRSGGGVLQWPRPLLRDSSRSHPTPPPDARVAPSMGCGLQDSVEVEGQQGPCDPGKGPVQTETGPVAWPAEVSVSPSVQQEL